MIVLLALCFFSTLLAASTQLVTGYSGSKLSRAAASASIVSITTVIVAVWMHYANRNPLLSALDYMPYVYVNLGIVIVIGFLVGNDRDFTPNTVVPLSCLALSFLLFTGIDLAVNPHDTIGLICNQDRYTALAKMASIDFSGASHADLDPNELIAMTPDLAISAARTEIAKGYSSYLEVGSVQLQYVNGHPYAIVSMKPTNYSAFISHDASIPGYYKVDALKANAPAELVKADIKYVDGLQGMNGLNSIGNDHDLGRIVFEQVTQPNGVMILDLDTLEVDNNWRPYNTGLLVKPAVGTWGYTPVGYLVFDPQTGDRTTYSITTVTAADGSVSYEVDPNLPSWIQNVFPQDFFVDKLNFWGSFAFSKICAQQANANRYQLDELPGRPESNVFTKTGREWQFSMTSHNQDTAMAAMIFADPRTGKMTGFTNIAASDFATAGLPSNLAPNPLARLQILETVGKNMVTQGNSDFNLQNGETVLVEDMQVQQMLGQYVIYAILTKANDMVADGRPYKAFQRQGVVMVLANQTNEQSAYVTGATVPQAYSKLQRKIALGNQDSTNISATAEAKPVSGNVETIGVFSDGSVARISLLVKVSPDGAESIFVLDSTPVTALIQPGDGVRITVLKLDVGAVNEVISLEDLTRPIIKWQLQQ